ncbi:MAG: hypothetical protein V8T86_12730 [Victivallis sp.]
MTNEYPGWLPAPESRLLETATMLYRELFGRAALVKVIPAGLSAAFSRGNGPGST